MSTEDRWIKKLWCVYTVEHDSPMKQDELMPLSVASMALEMFLLSGGGQTEEGKRPRVITYGPNRKVGANELIYETETDSQTKKRNFWLERFKVGWRAR